MLFPLTLPLSESYPEAILTDIRRLVSSSFGMLALNLRRFKVRTIETNTGPPATFTPVWQGSVYSQVKPSMAYQFGLPLLLVREEDTDANNGIWAGGIAPLNRFIVCIPKRKRLSNSLKHQNGDQRSPIGAHT